MSQNIKILIVEDEMVIGANIALFLDELGYEVTALLPKPEAALQHVTENMPDLALLDIRLKGEMDGIALADTLYNLYQLPVIFLTANVDDHTFNRAKAARPFAFLPKPFRKTELQRTIELAISRMETVTDPEYLEPVSDLEAQIGKDAYLLHDRIFLRYKERMVKVLFEDILYVEADRSYCQVFTGQRAYLLTMPMKKLEDMLPTIQFQRIHRSYIVNVRHVEEVGEGQVMVGEKFLPLSPALREVFMYRFQMP